MIQEGGAEVNLIRLGNEASMDDKLASLITYVQRHPHVVRVELQASENFRLVILSRRQLPDARDSARSLQRNAQDAERNCQVVARAEYFPPRVCMEQKSLDLTQIDFVPVIRARLLAAGEKAGVRVLLSNPDGTALRRP